MAAAMPAMAETSSDLEADPLETAYQEWVLAVETMILPDAAWEFPFKAPGPGQLSEQDMKTLLSLRRLVRNGDLEKLAAQVEIIFRAQTELPVSLRFWMAYAQSSLDRKETCLDNLQLLLQEPAGHQHLEPGQIAWVLTALADLNFLVGDRQRAALMYRNMAASRVSQLNLWGQYQMAGMDFLDRNFAEANRRYEVVCEAEKSGTWREHACAMAEIAGRLNSLNLKGEAHGDLAVVSP